MTRLARTPPVARRFRISRAVTIWCNRGGCRLGSELVGGLVLCGGLCGRQAVSNIGEGRELFRQITSQHTRPITPSPIAMSAAGNVHPGFASQSQHILQRNDAHLSYGSVRRPKERPVDSIIERPQVSPDIAPLLLGG